VALHFSAWVRVSTNEDYRAGLVKKEDEYVWSGCGESYEIRKGPLDLEIF